MASNLVASGNIKENTGADFFKVMEIATPKCTQHALHSQEACFGSVIEYRNSFSGNNYCFVLTLLLHFRLHILSQSLATFFKDICFNKLATQANRSGVTNSRVKGKKDLSAKN